MQLIPTAGLIATSARSLPPFKLYQPKSTAEALRALAQSHRPAILAGGSDLVAAFNEGLQPQELISLAGVAELHHVQATAQGLRIGAMVSHHAGSTHPLLLQQASGVAQAWASLTKPRVRFTGTLGGNLMARRVRYEGSVLMAAAQASLVFASAQGVQRLTPAELWSSAPEPRAVLTHIELPTAQLVAYGYERSMRPLLTLAVALHRAAHGLMLCCAVASEHLQPALLTLPLPDADLASVGRDARRIASDVFDQLPGSFSDVAVTHAYARAAGAVLLSRRLAALVGVAGASAVTGVGHG